VSVQTVHANNSRQLSKCGERASKSSVYFKPYQEYPSVAMLCPSGPFLNAHIKNWWHCFFGIRAACPPPQVKAGASSHHAIPPQVITIPMCIEHACTNQTILMHAGGAPAGGACMQVVPLQVVHACRWCMHAGGAPAGGAPAGGACMQEVHACRWCPWSKNRRHIPYRRWQKVTHATRAKLWLVCPGSRAVFSMAPACGK